VTDALTPTSQVGNITRGCSLKFSTKGTAWVTFGLAVRRYTPKDVPKPPTKFFDVVAFGSLAEHCAECLTVGDRVVVVGKSSLERYTGRDGVESVTEKIAADAVGVDLRFVTVQVERIERRKPAPVPSDGYAADEEPF
jgi:single-strand DNA-binding protein